MILQLQLLLQAFVEDSHGKKPNVLIMNANDARKLDSELNQLLIRPQRNPERLRDRTILGVKVIERPTYAPPYFALRA